MGHSGSLRIPKDLDLLIEARQDRGLTQEETTGLEGPAEETASSLPLRVAVASLVALTTTGALATTVGGTAATLLFLLSQVTVISIVIWQACDPFAEAAQWIGTKMRLPGSVRGATLDAIASSMPELFSGIFFVLVAIRAAPGSGLSAAHIGGDGYGPTLATCAGSAIYNMILIPAICALVISYSRKRRPTIDVSPEVIQRDGMWFLGCEALLILFLFQSSLQWWMGVVFMALYAIYVNKLYRDARAYRLAHAHGHAAAEAAGEEDEDEGPPEEAGFLFGLASVKLDMKTAWAVIAVTTVVAATSCYWLVEVTRATAAELEVPLFFVAVIIAAAASSVPDTFLSIGAARRGDDDGAVSNAFGSNIFDICICLSIPLLVSTWLNGWQPISLTQNGEPMPGLVGIRIMLCFLTVVTLAIMWHKRQLTRRKAFVLVGLYGLFVCYAISGSLGYTLSSLTHP